MEFTGQDVESMSFTMFFSVFLGVNPIAEVANLLQTMRRGEAHYLIIGPESVWDKQVGSSPNCQISLANDTTGAGNPAGRVGKRNHAIIFEQIGGRTMAYTVKAYALEKSQPRAGGHHGRGIAERGGHPFHTEIFPVPLERGLGLAQRFLDKPIPAAQSILISEVLEAIEEFEPRAEVENVTFELGDRPGTLIPIVEVKIIGGDE